MQDVSSLPLFSMKIENGHQQIQKAAIGLKYYNILLKTLLNLSLRLYFILAGYFSGDENNTYSEIKYDITNTVSKTCFDLCIKSLKIRTGCVFHP